MRVFIAATLDKKIQDNIRDFQTKMKLETVRYKRQINWIFPDECHITLAFIGEVPDDDIPNICDVVDTVVAKAAPFRIKAEGVRAFGRTPRVIWAAIKDGAEPLGELHTKLTEALEPAGFYKEKLRFSPHITLARITDPKAGKYMKDIAVTLNSYPFGVMALRSIDLYKSVLGKYGAIYTHLAQFPFGSRFEE